MLHMGFKHVWIKEFCSENRDSHSKSAMTVSIRHLVMVLTRWLSICSTALSEPYLQGC